MEPSNNQTVAIWFFMEETGWVNIIRIIEFGIHQSATAVS
jgi:hypothetical protein